MPGEDSGCVSHGTGAPSPTRRDPHLNPIRKDSAVDATSCDRSHRTILLEQLCLRRPGLLAPSFQPNLLLRGKVTAQIEFTATFFFSITEAHASSLSETIVPGDLCAAPYTGWKRKQGNVALTSAPFVRNSLDP